MPDDGQLGRNISIYWRK